MTTTNRCISLAGHFNGHGNTQVRYWAHWQMRRAQHFSWSHWTPQLVKYLLSIAPTTARIPYTHAKNTTKTNASHLLVILMAMAMRRYGTERINQCVVLRASTEATGRRNWLSICSILPWRLPGSHTSKQKDTIKQQNKHPTYIAHAKKMYCLLYFFPWVNFAPKIGGKPTPPRKITTN